MTSLDMGYWGGPMAELERLAGPLRSVPGPLSAFEVREGTYRGEPIRAVWLGRVTSGSGSRGSTLHLAASLGDRPIDTYVWARKGSTIFGPTAVTGDADFDERYIAAARPQEVVSAALDEHVRAMIERRWPGRDTTISTADGWVSIIAGTSTPGRHGTPPAPTGPELQSVLDDVVLLAGRLRWAYDARRAQLVAEGGEAAAQAWEQGAVEDLATKQRTGRLVAVVAVAVVVLIVVAIIALVVALVG